MSVRGAAGRRIDREAELREQRRGEVEAAQRLARRPAARRTVLAPARVRTRASGPSAGADPGREDARRDPLDRVGANRRGSRRPARDRRRRFLISEPAMHVGAGFERLALFDQLAVAVVDEDDRVGMPVAHDRDQRRDRVDRAASGAPHSRATAARRRPPGGARAARRPARRDRSRRPSVRGTST